VRNQSFVANLQIANIELIGELDGVIEQLLSGGVIVGQDATIVEIREADEEPAEEQATDVREGQQPAHTSRAKGLKTVWRVLQAVLQGQEPRGMPAQWHLTEAPDVRLPEGDTLGQFARAVEPNFCQRVGGASAEQGHREL
jgi:hypothetical protein